MIWPHPVFIVSKPLVSLSLAMIVQVLEFMRSCLPRSLGGGLKFVGVCVEVTLGQIPENQFTQSCWREKTTFL